MRNNDIILDEEVFKNKAEIIEECNEEMLDVELILCKQTELTVPQIESNRSEKCLSDREDMETKI